MKNKEAVDIVIVGAGAAGSQLAAKLAKGGKRVVVLEAGPPWELRDLFSSQIWARRLKWAASPVSTSGTAPVPVTFNLGGGLGGSAIHHYANWYRLHPEDFKEQSLYGQNLDWPISYDDLRPFYDEIQTEIGISGDTQAETVRPPAAPYPMPPVKSFNQAKLISQGFANLGISTFPTPHAINSVEYKGRNACLNDGWCDAGCPIGALANPLVTNIPAARAAGVEFRCWANVTKIVTAANGESVSGVQYQDQSGSPYFQPAAAVILAAHCIQTPRLLLASATSRFPSGLANRSNTVGQYIMAHTALGAYGLFNEDTEPYRGVVGGTVSSQDAYKQKVNSTYFGSYMLQGALAVKPNDLIGIANTRPDLFGTALDSFLQNAAHHIGSLSMLGESRPLKQNQVTLLSQTDSFGVPLAQVTHAFDSDALAIAAASIKVAMNALKAAGATQVWTGSISGEHILGGTIMGSDPTSSVTNGYGQTHDVANLFIAGSGLFPTCGAVNPTFTIQSLAARTAKYLLSDWKSIAGRV